MKDSSIAVVGAKDVTEIFGVCGFELHESFTHDVEVSYPFVLCVEGDELHIPPHVHDGSTAFPIVMEIKWRGGNE